MNRSSSPLMLAAALLASAMGAGCLGSSIYQNDKDLGTSADQDAGNGPGPDMAVDPKALFEANVQPLLISDCGACHAQAGGSYPGFLAAAPSVYTTFLAFPGLVGATPETSRILLKDVHVGPSYHASNGYTPSADLTAHAKIIADWITLYNAAGGATTMSGSTDMAKKARIMPFLPVMGTQKSIDLGELDPAFTGVTVTFTPTAIGSPATSIQLKDLTLKATATVGVKTVSPVFARYDAATPTVAIDIDYDYIGKEISAFAGGTTVFDPSLTIFPYIDGQLIDLSFVSLTALSGSAPDMGAVGACKNVPGFTTFKPMLTGTAGINCNTCHAAAPGGFNTAGIGNAANDAATCAEVLVNTVPATPASSPIYVTVTGTGNHTGGKLSAANATAFLDALTTWLNTEK